MILQRTARTIENVPLAERTFRIRLDCPEIAAAIRPGQFVMLRLPGTSDPLLGRPFALYDTVLDSAGTPVAIDVVYLVIGKMTGLLAQMKTRRADRSLGPARQRLPGSVGLRTRRLRGRRNWSDTVSWPTFASCSAPAATAGRRHASSASASRSTTACEQRRWRQASKTSAPPAATSILPATTARSAYTASSRSCSPAITPPARSSAAAQSRCCTHSES